MVLPVVLTCSMTTEQLNQIPLAERRYYAQCRICEEWYDTRVIEEAVDHLRHEGLPDMLTLLESCPACSKPMVFEKYPRDGFVGVWTCLVCGAEKWSETPPLQIRRQE